MSQKRKLCWVISENKAGMVAQARGLAEALQRKYAALDIEFAIVYRLIIGRAPWRYLPNRFWPKGKFNIDLLDGTEFDAPWPDLVISSGRKAAPVARDIKIKAQQAGQSCFNIHIQRPDLPLTNFDLVTTPFHDHLTGQNVIPTLGSLGPVTRDLLDQAATQWHKKFSHLKPPYIAVPIGGDNKVYRYQEKDMLALADILRQFVQETGGSLLLTASRRTSVANMSVLQKAIADLPQYFWDGTGDNPYFGFLGLADYVVVTCDSANMLSEACATGKPVYVFHIAPNRKTKFDEFHHRLEQQGYCRKAGGHLESWTYPPLNEAEEIADRVMTLLDP